MSEAVIVDGGLHAVLSRRATPKRLNAMSAALAFGWRAILKIKHVPFQLFDVTAFPIMFTLMFTLLFGGALEGSPREYIQYLLPGILVQTIIFLTMYTGMGLNTDITKGLFDRFRSLPIWQPAPIVGMLVGDAFRFSLASLIIITLGFILGFRPENGAIGVILGVLLVLLFAFSLTWVGTTVGMVVKTPESVMTTTMLFMFPLTFISNIFVRPETMPDWVEFVVRMNPVSHLASAVRGLMHGGVQTTDLIWVFVTSGLLVLVFGPLTMRMYRRER